MEQAIIETEKNLPRGTIEGIPSRQTGKENKGLLSPTQDEYTENRRAHYGQNDVRERIGNPDDLSFNVNDTHLKNNPTRDEKIRGDNSDKGAETGYARVMTQ
jgi:hypothetical protein